MAALGLVGWALASGQNADPEVFFSAGSLLLIAGLAGCGGVAGTPGRGVHAQSRFTFHVPRLTPLP